MLEKTKKFECIGSNDNVNYGAISYVDINNKLNIFWSSNNNKHLLWRQNTKRFTFDYNSRNNGTNWKWYIGRIPSANDDYTGYIKTLWGGPVSPITAIYNYNRYTDIAQIEHLF